MGYPNPIKFIRYVAEKSRCANAGQDAEIEVALDWLREQIIDERNRQEARAEREDARSMSDDDA